MRAEQAAQDAEQRLLDFIARAESAETTVAAADNATPADANDANAKILDLEKEILRLQREIDSKEDAHREAATRAAEYYDQYEAARETVSSLKQQLASVNAQCDALKLESKELKRKVRDRTCIFVAAALMIQSNVHIFPKIRRRAWFSL